MDVYDEVDRRETDAGEQNMIKHELLHHKDDASCKHVFCLKYFCVKKLLIVVVSFIVLSSGACSFKSFLFGWFCFYQRDLWGKRNLWLNWLIFVLEIVVFVSLTESTAEQHRQFNPVLFIILFFPSLSSLACYSES